MFKTKASEYKKKTRTHLEAWMTALKWEDLPEACLCPKVMQVPMKNLRKKQ